MKKAVKKKTARKKRIPAAQRIKKDYEVGYGKPPKEHQFKPGQSGNPTGNTKGRTNLWVWFCKFMNMTESEIKAFKKSKGILTLSQQTALKLVENAAKGEYSGSERLARHAFDREEGKPTEHLVVGGTEKILSDEDCEEIREILRKNFEAATGSKK